MPPGIGYGPDALRTILEAAMGTQAGMGVAGLGMAPAQGGAPFEPPPPRPGAPSERQQLLDVVYGAPPQEVLPEPEKAGTGRGLLAGLADALITRAAVASGNPGLRSDFRGEITGRRERNRELEVRSKNRQTQLEDQARRAKAERQLKDLDTREERGREDTRRKEDRQWTTDQFNREAAIRRTEREQDRTERAGERAQDRAERVTDREDSQAFQERMGRLEAGWRRELAGITDTKEKDKQRELVTQARVGILGMRDALDDELKKKTPAQVRQAIDEKLDALGLEEGTPAREAAQAYWDLKVEPTLREYEQKTAAETARRKADEPRRRRIKAEVRERMRRVDFTGK